MTPISAVVEGAVDGAVLQRLVRHCGGEVGNLYDQHGKVALLRRLSGYAAAAAHAPWIVLVDLDADADCAPTFLANLGVAPAANLCLRIVVREMEAWLMGDRERFASHLGVAVSHVPPHPELLDDPKATVVELARRSRRRDVRADIVPAPTGGRKVGPGYVGQILRFLDADRGWRIGQAAAAVPSLERALHGIAGLVQQWP